MGALLARALSRDPTLPQGSPSPPYRSLLDQLLICHVQSFATGQAELTLS